MARTPWNNDLPGVEVSAAQIESSDVLLRGETLRPATRGPWPGAILLHGMAVGRKILRPAARRLASHGLAVLIYDLRGHGDSGGVYSGGGADDLLAAFRWFQERPNVLADHIGVVGHSLGGRIVLIASAMEPAVAATVALAPDSVFEGAYTADDLSQFASRVFWYPGVDVPGKCNLHTWYMNYQMLLNGYQLRIDWARTAETWNRFPIESAVRSREERPLLLINGTLDNKVSYKKTAMLHDIARPPKDLWLISMGLHGTPCGPTASRRWSNWLAEQLLPE